MSVPVYTSPVPCNLGKAAISTLAENLARRTGFEAGSDLEGFVADRGGRIRYQDIWELDSSESGSIEVRDDDDFVITLAAHTSRERDQFTIAHELGHYYLHYLLPKLRGKPVGPLRAARYGGDRAEIEANWFAASFLMPKDEFLQAYRDANGDVSLVANRFGVSTSAVSVRAKSLGVQV